MIFVGRVRHTTKCKRVASSAQDEATAPKASNKNIVDTKPTRNRRQHTRCFQTYIFSGNAANNIMSGDAEGIPGRIHRGRHDRATKMATWRLDKVNHDDLIDAINQ